MLVLPEAATTVVYSAGLDRTGRLHGICLNQTGDDGTLVRTCTDAGDGRDRSQTLDSDRLLESTAVTFRWWLEEITQRDMSMRDCIWEEVRVASGTATVRAFVTSIDDGWALKGAVDGALLVAYGLGGSYGSLLLSYGYVLPQSGRPEVVE